VKTCAQCQVNYPDAVEFCPADGARLPGEMPKPAPDPLIGSTLDGRYLVESLLGLGGMGYVYAGRHAIIDKRVAIKVLRAEHAQHDESAAQRFLVEAKAASKIGHQNIVDITDFGVLADGKTYFIMEFLDGPTLGKLVHHGQHVSALRAIGIAVQIARGLAAAHDKGIVHRDLKPENIFILEKDGQRDFVKIVDFGIAKDQSYKKKLTQAGMVLGTPEYMSPEQATGQATDHRVDMYALGCIVYEMLTGEVPFKSDTPTKTLTQHVFEKVIRPSERRPDLEIPPALEAVVMRALQKKPDERFADLKEMIAALERVEKELQARGGREPSQRGALRRALTPAATDTQAELDAIRGPMARRKQWLIAGGAALGLASIVTGALLVRSGKPTRPAQSAAAQAASPTPNIAAAPAAVPQPTTSASPGEVEIVLRTSPPGAQVLEGGKVIGMAPVRLSRPRGELATVYTFRQSGYKEEARSVAPTSDKDIEVVLVARAGRGGGEKPGGEKVARAGKGAPRGGSDTHIGGAKAAPTKARVSDLRNPFD
jgi:serine/threonine-protein kinase